MFNLCLATILSIICTSYSNPISNGPIKTCSQQNNCMDWEITQSDCNSNCGFKICYTFKFDNYILCSRNVKE